MPTSPASREASGPAGRSDPVRRGFTVVEMLVAVTVSGLVLAGILGTSLELMRSSLRASYYSEMESQVRRALAQLEIDLKAASNLTLNSPSDLTVTIPRGDGTEARFTYSWNATSQVFFRVPGASSTNPDGRIELVRGIPARADGSAGLQFTRLDPQGRAALTDGATKRVQISLTVSRSPGTAAHTTSTVTATYLLRNKLSS